MPRIVFIVSKGNTAKYEELKREFAHEDIVDVVLDRRQGERRVQDVATQTERRQRERRQHQVDGELQEKGWALIRKLL